MLQDLHVPFSIVIYRSIHCFACKGWPRSYAEAATPSEGLAEQVAEQQLQ